MAGVLGETIVMLSVQEHRSLRSILMLPVVRV